ncbi:HDOD domain-containing protein [Methylomonas sp. AM2-LC]|uniref:EAL and HDOD domain-containing protein n=1 Tax=Methylomonas sp. AM2-LC TaxID=3153301 RepID=UPI0032658596
MTDFLIGRQQILDSNLNTFAYEILFRGKNFDLTDNVDATNATNQVVTDTILEIGLNEIVGTHKAFINFTGQNILDKTPLLLPKDRIVIEVLESVHVDAVMINSLKELSKAGYTIALDDFVLTDEWRPLLDFANIIKLDIITTSLPETQLLIEELKPYNVTLLAEKIETHQEFEILRHWGCRLFQGFFFSRPNIVEGKRLSINQSSAIHLLSVVNKADIRFEEISNCIAQDAGLSYKLLHYINSAFFSLPIEIESIQQAITFLGLLEMKRWINILALSSLSNKPHAILQIAMIRAKMCELMAEQLNEDPNRYFLIGMLSCLDIILDMPLEKVLIQLPLPKEIAEAILHKTGKAGETLQYTINYERWELSSNQFRTIKPQIIASIYIDSINWANDVLNNLN